MKKSIWAVIMLALCCVLAFSACDKGTNQPSDTGDGNQQTTAADETEAPTEAPTAASTEAITEHQHALGEWAVTKAPTCTKAGEEKRTCQGCDLTETREVAALGHDEVPREAKAPTCTEIGWDAYVACSRCDYTTYAEKAMISHDYVNGLCQVCGQKQPSEGLTYESVPGGYSVSGIGTCTDTDIVIPATYDGKPVTSIGEKAFFKCSSLASITIPDSVKNIDFGAFLGCENLTSISIPDSVTSIGATAFHNTAYYKNADNWVDGVLYIGHYLIAAQSDKLPANYTIKVGTKCIANSAFFSCDSLTSITIPNSVTSMGKEALFGCRSLTSITFEGTKAQWNAISKGENWTTHTGAYTIQYTDGDIAK